MQLILFCGELKFWRLDTSCGCLQLRRLDTSYGWFHPMGDSGSSSRIRVAADFAWQLTRVPVAGYELRLTPSHSWFEFRRLDMSCGWLCPTVDSSSGDSIRVAADSVPKLTQVPAARYELPLILSCGWLEFYTLIYQVNLRTYFAKFIIFLVRFLPSDLSYHWSRFWLLLGEPWKILKKLQNSSCIWF